MEGMDVRSNKESDQFDDPVVTHTGRVVRPSSIRAIHNTVCHQEAGLERPFFTVYQGKKKLTFVEKVFCSFALGGKTALSI